MSNERWYANTDENEGYDVIDKGSEYGTYMRNRRMINDAITPFLKSNYRPQRGVSCRFCHAVMQKMDDGITNLCPHCGYKVIFKQELQMKAIEAAAKKPKVRPKESSADNKFFVKQLGRRTRTKNYDETQKAMFEKGWDIVEH